MSRQLPQVAPAPVRIVNSATLRQPASAAWRMSRSVTPVQEQTIMPAPGQRAEAGREAFEHPDRFCQEHF